jgi:hypothetical protein
MKYDVSSLFQRNDKLQEVVSQLKEQLRLQGDQAAAVARSKTEALSSLVAARTELETATAAYSSLQQAHTTVLGRLRAAVCPEPSALTDAAVLDCVCASFVDASTLIHNYNTKVQECTRANTLLTQQLASAELGLATAEQALQDSSAVLARHKVISYGRIPDVSIVSTLVNVALQAEIAELASCKQRLEAFEAQQAQQLQLHSQQLAELVAQRDNVMSRCQYLEELQHNALLSHNIEVTTEVNAHVDGDGTDSDVLFQRANLQDAALREVNLVAELNEARALLSSQKQTIDMLKDELQSVTVAAPSVETSR